MVKRCLRRIGVAGLENKIKVELAVVLLNNPCTERIGCQAADIKFPDIRLKDCKNIESQRKRTGFKSCCFFSRSVNAGVDQDDLVWKLQV